MTTLPPYPAYKDSGAPWLGEVPAQWEQRALWTLSKPSVERNPGNAKLLSVFLDRGVIPYDQGGGQVHAPSIDLSNYQMVYPGDFVLNNQQAWRGSVDVSSHQQIMSELDRQLKGLNHSSLVIEKQIDLMREYRTRLIADVVTGRIDVRAAAAANLPAEPDEANEPLDDGDEDAEELDEDATNDGEVDEG